MKNVNNVEQLVKYLRKGVTICHFEHRSPKYMFGTKNYGDIPAYRNPADGDAWDVFAPGYLHNLPFSTPFVVGSVIGYLRLSNGNHKIAVRLKDVPGYDQGVADAEISRYCRTYLQKVRHGTHSLQGEFVWVDP